LLIYYVKLKKKNKNPVLDIGHHHLFRNSQIGVSRLYTSSVTFQGSGSPGYFAKSQLTSHSLLTLPTEGWALAVHQHITSLAGLHASA